MFNSSARKSTIRLSILAGVVALAVGDVGTSAQAFPKPVPVSNTGAPMTTVGYDGDMAGHHRHRHARHHARFGENAHPNHPGYAGLYDCGPGGVRTRLSRKACGGGNRFQHLQQAY